MSVYYCSVETAEGKATPGGLAAFPFTPENDDEHDMHSRRNSDGTWNAGESSPFITVPADGIAWISAEGGTSVLDGKPTGPVTRVRAGQAIALAVGTGPARLTVSVHTDIEQPDPEKIRVRVGTDPYADVVDPAPVGETGTGSGTVPDWPK